MSARTWLRIAALAIVVALGVSIYQAWRGAQREQAQLQEKVKSAQQVLSEATARQQSRQADLEQQLAQLQQEKATVQNPAQVVKALPDVLPLPKPLVLPAPHSPTTGQASGKDKPDAPSPAVQLPAEDLKPLYDYAVGCKACQEQLATAQANLADEKVKTQALGKERDDALQAAKGGSLLQRVARAAKWFALGAAAGVVAAKMAH